MIATAAHQQQESSLGEQCQYRRYRCFSSPIVSVSSSSYCANHLDKVEPPFQQCEYISNRLRIRCSNVRREEQLRPNGFCEKHYGYIERIKADSLKSRSLLDPGFPKKDTLNGEKPSDVYSENVDETLDVIGGEDWPYVHESLYCDARIDDPDNPLRNAGVFTKKEVIREYLTAMERQKEAIQQLRVIYAEKYKRLLANYPKLAKDSKKNASSLTPKSKKALAEHKSNKKYGGYAKWRKTSYFMEKNSEKAKKILAVHSTSRPGNAGAPLNEVSNTSADSKTNDIPFLIANGCQHAEKVNIGKPKPPVYQPEADSDIHLSPEQIVQSVLCGVVNHIDKLDTYAKQTDQFQTRMCAKKRLPLSDFCPAHILTDTQKLFAKCVDCDQPALILNGLSRCKLHSGDHSLSNLPFNHNVPKHHQRHPAGRPPGYICSPTSPMDYKHFTNHQTKYKHIDHYEYSAVAGQQTALKADGSQFFISNHQLGGGINSRYNNSQPALILNDRPLLDGAVKQKKALKSRKPEASRPLPNGFVPVPNEELFANSSDEDNEAELNGQMQAGSSNNTNGFSKSRDRKESARNICIEDDIDSTAYVQQSNEWGQESNATTRTTLNTNFLLHSTKNSAPEGQFVSIPMSAGTNVGQRRLVDPSRQRHSLDSQSTFREVVVGPDPSKLPLTPLSSKQPLDKASPNGRNGFSTNTNGQSPSPKLLEAESCARTRPFVGKGNQPSKPVSNGSGGTKRIATMMAPPNQMPRYRQETLQSSFHKMQQPRGMGAPMPKMARLVGRNGGFPPPSQPIAISPRSGQPIPMSKIIQGSGSRQMPMNMTSPGGQPRYYMGGSGNSHLQPVYHVSQGGGGLDITNRLAMVNYRHIRFGCSPLDNQPR
uniref:KAT8 regulatory NSL complex subunit 2 n=1 Tax=Ditylenchus dipsaci TaxID=166011 RepID=A0A915DA33_9BILA